MQTLKQILQRTSNSAVVWSWAFNGLRLASGLVLLPLLVRVLAKPEFGMYYLFLSIIALLPIIDFGFSSAVGRFVSYAMAGAETLRPQGYVPAISGSGPNRPLLWRLLRTTRRLYGYLTLLGFLVMGIYGTLVVGSQVGETGSVAHTWIAWVVTLGGAALEIYSNWWNAYLFGMNRVRDSARIQVCAYALKLVLSCVLLLAGGGLLSVPIAGIVGCLLNRTLSRRVCLQTLGPAPDLTGQQEPSLLPLLWPNSWRTGLQLFSSYLRTSINTAICAASFGLAAAAEYGLSTQILGIALGMAAVWTSVKWPMVGQYRSAQNLEGLRIMLWPRVWLQLLTFIVLSAAAILVGPFLLDLIRSDKQMLPSHWLVLLALVFLLDQQFSFWGTLLTLENRIPTLWPTVATNLTSLALALGFTHFSNLGVLGLILAPLLSGLVFNYWYWPLAGAKSLGTTLIRYMVTRPRPAGRPMQPGEPSR